MTCGAALGNTGGVSILCLSPASITYSPAAGMFLGFVVLTFLWRCRYLFVLFIAETAQWCCAIQCVTQRLCVSVTGRAESDV